MIKKTIPNGISDIAAATKKMLRKTPQKSTSFFEWDSLIGKQAAVWRASGAGDRSPRVLIATSMGGYQQGALLESALAVALTLRGAKVEILLCDEFLPACQLTKNGG